jgi:hypothetical protein
VNARKLAWPYPCELRDKLSLAANGGAITSYEQLKAALETREKLLAAQHSKTSVSRPHAAQGADRTKPTARTAHIP